MDQESPEHPDPEWWKRCAPCHYPVTRPPPGLPIAYPLDICDTCGHIREMHVHGVCSAASTGLFGRRGVPCICTERVDDGLWRTTTNWGGPIR